MTDPTDKVRDDMTKPQAKRLLNILLIAICLLTFRALAADQPAPDLRFTILHTNDLHAHDDTFVDRGRNVGGMAKIAHIIRSIRAHNPNVVAIDAGDIFQGTPYYKFYHGEVEVEMLNDAGYDLYTIGNHEFDDGPENLAKQLKRAHFDIISSNLDASKLPELAALIKPSVVKTIKGQKVAFIGAIVPTLAEVSLKTEVVKVKATGDQWMDPIKEEIARVKAQGIDKIVLVTHVGVELDKQLAQLPDVDVIIGGHSHTRLDKPIVVHHADGSDCIVVQTGSYGRALGKLDLDFDQHGKVKVASTDYRLINITDRIHDDKDVQKYLAEKEKPFAKMRTTVDGVAITDFDNSFKRFPGDSPIGDLIADALAEGGSQYGATIAFQNRGGIRGRIERGPITEEKVDEILPFENHLLVATVKGSDLKKVLENSVAGSLGAKFLDVHGIKFTYDASKPPMQRIVTAETEGADNTWKPLSDSADYRIAINDYSFKGGEGYDFSHASDIKDTGRRLSAYLGDYLLHHKKVTPATPGRITAVGLPATTATTTKGKKH